jgi:HTH-type transcriptional regulator/antitoxin HigA
MNNHLTNLPFTPEWLSHPGETIADFLEELNWTQAELAMRLGYSTKHVSQLMNGKVPITSETAIKLSQVLGSSVQFWLNIEANYQADLARLRHDDRLQEWIPWLKELPIKELQKMGVLSNCRITQEVKSELVAQLLSFFACASPKVWRDYYSSLQTSVNFRKSSSIAKIGSAAAWLRLGEIAAQNEIDKVSQPFDKRKFEKAIPEFRNLASSDSADFNIQTSVRQLCRELGVIFVFIPSLPGAKISGVSRWFSSQSPLIQVSLYGKTNDKFWFTFFHEAAHVLLHSKNKIFVDEVFGYERSGEVSREEQEADQWAKDILIPNQYTSRIRTLKSGKLVTAFAKEVGIHPGIVVGRLQHEGILSMEQLNALKVSYEFKSDFPVDS